MRRPTPRILPTPRRFSYFLLTLVSVKLELGPTATRAIRGWAPSSWHAHQGVGSYLGLGPPPRAPSGDGSKAVGTPTKWWGAAAPTTLRPET